MSQLDIAPLRPTLRRFAECVAPETRSTIERSYLRELVAFLNYFSASRACNLLLNTLLRAAGRAGEFLLTNGVLTLILTVLTEYEALSRAFLNDLIQCIANIVGESAYVSLKAFDPAPIRRALVPVAQNSKYAVDVRLRAVNTLAHLSLHRQPLLLRS